MSVVSLPWSKYISTKAKNVTSTEGLLVLLHTTAIAHMCTKCTCVCLKTKFDSISIYLLTLLVLFFLVNKTVVVYVTVRGLNIPNKIAAYRILIKPRSAYRCEGILCAFTTPFRSVFFHFGCFCDFDTDPYTIVMY